MTPGTLHIAQAQLILGIIDPDALPTIASRALEEGWESMNLRKLANLGERHSANARSMFTDVLREFGMGEMTVQDAVVTLAKEEARGILVGRTAPISGAKRIWDLALKLPGDDIVPELHPFVYAASEWDDRGPEDRRNFELGIVESARDLLNASP